MPDPRTAEALVTGDEPASWPAARDRLAGADRYWLTTLGPDGRPRTRPVLAVWSRSALHFCTSPTTAKGTDLGRDPRCTVTTSDEAADLVLEGTVRRVTGADIADVAARYVDKYEWEVEIRADAFWAEGAPTAGPPPFHVFAVEPVAAYVFPVDGSFTATRWTFDG